MIRIQPDPNELEQIKRLRYEHPHSHIQRRFEILLLCSFDLSHDFVAELAGVHPNTVTAALRDYQSGGLELVKQWQCTGSESALTPQRDSIVEMFERKPPSTLKEACCRIEELTGIKRKASQVRRFLRGEGFHYLKAGGLPAKADIDKQNTFLAEELQPRLAEAAAGKRTVFFMDASHFVLCAFLSYFWCLARVWVKTPSGRQRYNVLGALNVQTQQVLTFVNDTYINAESVCSLLITIAKAAKGVPVTIVLDNARYQHCALVQAKAEALGLELLFLPPYSPQLNLIERFWKYVKKECLANEYYSDFSKFCSAIDGCINDTSSKKKQELSTLLAPNFQTFSESQNRAA